VSFAIKQPETGEEFKRYYQLRWEILRAPWNQAKGSEVDDIEDQCVHVMAIETSSNDKYTVIGVARLQYNSDNEAQIRYMAVASEHQRKGIGRALVNTLEQFAQNSSCNKMILDAREPAIGFYYKLGYKIVEKSYLLFDEIQHYQMIKMLQP
jgi:ribosomal protein S18 acetylase RimI-like enzyme